MAYNRAACFWISAILQISHAHTSLLFFSRIFSTNVWVLWWKLSQKKISFRVSFLLYFRPRNMLIPTRKRFVFLHQVTIERWGRTEMITSGGGLKGVGGGVTRRGGCNMINMEISASIYFCSSNSSIVFWREDLTSNKRFRYTEAISCWSHIYIYTWPNSMIRY